MIEGTRHERAAIVALAYVIGFVTAAIAAGVGSGESVTVATAPSSIQSANVHSAVATPDLTVEERKSGLYVQQGGEEVLLSANMTATDMATAQDGVYARLSKYELSPDERYVYFCEQPSLDATSCAPYVYVVEDSTVYSVTRDGARIGVTSDDHAIDWSAGGLATIAGVAVDPLH